VPGGSAPCSWGRGKLEADDRPLCWLSRLHSGCHESREDLGDKRREKWECCAVRRE
jgi:hypothetical protein